MLSPDTLRAAFDRGLRYDDYVATGSAAHRQSWQAFYDACPLDGAQEKLIAGFTRRIHAVAISGTWCGDCVQQLPFIARFERANPDLVRVRVLDRDEHPELADAVRICSGTRVPVVLYANEDFDFISLFGDRSLARYRAMAARQLGASCPLPGAPVPDEEVRATLQDWLDELERVHLLCRLSTKLRARHAD
jgi:thiol-disulfide isomerase/thioredoxin